jgi:hypothetical protein
MLHLNVAPRKINGLEGVKFWQMALLILALVKRETGVVVTIYDRQSERVTESDRERDRERETERQGDRETERDRKT